MSAIRVPCQNGVFLCSWPTQCSVLSAQTAYCTHSLPSAWEHAIPGCSHRGLHFPLMYLIFTVARRKPYRKSLSRLYFAVPDTIGNQSQQFFYFASLVCMRGSRKATWHQGSLLQSTELSGVLCSCHVRPLLVLNVPNAGCLAVEHSRADRGRSPERV